MKRNEWTIFPLLKKNVPSGKLTAIENGHL